LDDWPEPGGCFGTRTSWSRPTSSRRLSPAPASRGTQASISDVFDASAIGGEVSEPVREVQNYVAALNEGLRLLQTLPPSLRLIRQIHEVLLTDVRGSERIPGEFRTTPNWIGSPDERPDTAVFVPPPADVMTTALSDWERFIHEETAMPELVRCARSSITNSRRSTPSWTGTGVLAVS
jgi:Fic family protein